MEYSVSQMKVRIDRWMDRWRTRQIDGGKIDQNMIR